MRERTVQTDITNKISRHAVLRLDTVQPGYDVTDHEMCCVWVVSTYVSV